MRRINPVFLVGLLTASIVLAGATYLVHGFQLKRNAAALLDRARKAEGEEALSEAVLALRQYLNLRRDDGAAWRWYARLMDELHEEEEGRRQEVFLIYEEALRNNPGDRQLELRCVELALDPYLNQTLQAKKHLAALLRNPRDSRESARLEDLRGQAEAKEANFEAAAKCYALAIEHDPTLVSSYLRLARLRRTELRKGPKEADGLMDRMVRNNPTLGTAYLTRFRYDDLHRPPADRGDLRKALELAPEDVEVLQAAAAAAERSQDTATARGYLEKALGLDPGNTAIALALADLELRGQHLDRAATILRETVRLKPETTAVFRLAEVLIEQGEPDRASEYVALLRDRGFGQSLARVLDARRLMVEQKWPEAIGEIEAALVVLRSAPELSARLELMLAECHGRTGSDEQRVAALRRAVDGGVRAEAVRLELARALIRAREWDEAIKILEPMSEQRPELHLDITEVLIRQSLGRSGDARSRGRAGASLRKAEGALAQRPEFGQRLTLLRAELKLAGVNEAIRAGDYRRAVALAHEVFPERSLRPADHLALARVYGLIPGKTEDAGREYRRAIELGSGAPDAWVAHVGFLAQAGQREEARSAVRAARRSLSVEGSSLPLAHCCIMVGETEEAEALIQAALNGTPDDPATLRTAAGFYLMMGKDDEAEAMYRRLLDGNPDDVEALNNLAWLLALRARGGSRSPEEPLALINRAIEIAGRTPSLLDTKAMVLIRANKQDEAVLLLDDARSLDERNASVPLHRALALRGQGKIEEARDAFRTAVKLGWRPDRSDPLERPMINKLKQELGLRSTEDAGRK